MPHLLDPQLMASMRSVVADVSQTRSLLKTLGDRPDHEVVDAAKAMLAEIDSMFSNDLDEIKLSDKVDLEEEKQKKAIERERNLGQVSLVLVKLKPSRSSFSLAVNRLENEGYYGGVRLLMATCKVFTKYCKEQGINLHNNNFSLSYETNIPHKVIWFQCHCMCCLQLLVDFYKVRDKIGVEIRPQLILNAEKELGIVACLQDRVAQVYGGLVYMDFEKSKMDECGHGIYTQLDTSLLLHLHLIYVENPSDSGKVHSTVRQRWLDGDKFIISSMEKVANLALEGKTALLEKDYVKFATLMNQNFDLRRDLSYNQFIGDLPSSFETLRGLSRLFLQHIEFTGSVIFLADLQLSDLNIQDNHFSGINHSKTIPLHNLWFGGNMFDRGDMVLLWCSWSDHGSMRHESSEG
ncbi:hypothetical protein LXL04_026013 [Taraxacum kok-saghyz]